MKKTVVGIFILVIFFGLFGEEKKPVISGRIKLFTSAFASANPQGTFFTHDAGDFACKRMETRLKLSGTLGERIAYGFRLDAYAHAGELPLAHGFAEADVLGTPKATEHFEINLYEAQIKINRFLLKNLDLTLGKQRITWGSADKVSVVDLLNPIDFANFFTFDPDYFAEKRPQSALNFEYYLGQRSKLQLVWLLQHPMAPLPYGFTLLTSNSRGLSDIQVTRGWRESLQDTNIGLRLSTHWLSIDFALSYYHGNSSLPLLRQISMLSQPLGIFHYPNLDVLGVDASGEAFGIGFWAEVAAYFPEKIDAMILIPTIVNRQLQPVENRFPLLERTFYKYVLGLDYHFGHGIYANLQYLHGFFDEFKYSPEARDNFKLRKGMFFGEPSDYLLGRVEYTIPRGGLQAKLGGLLEMPGKKSAFLLMPELDLRIADGMILQAGAMIPFASGDVQLTKFGPFKKDRMVFISMRIDF